MTRRFQFALCAMGLWGVLGCAAGQARPESSDRPASEGSAQSDTAAGVDEATRENQQKMVRLERRIEKARIKLERVRRAQANAVIAEEQALDTARRNLELSEHRFKTFVDLEVPDRLERAALDVQRSEDGLLESEQELQQLEKMYAAEDFADDTKDIVIDRSRRRIERTRNDLELRRRSFAVLREKTIPHETIEKELALSGSRRAVETLELEAGLKDIDRRLELLDAEHEIVNLEEDIAELHRKMTADK